METSVVMGIEVATFASTITPERDDIIAGFVAVSGSRLWFQKKTQSNPYVVVVPNSLWLPSIVAANLQPSLCRRLPPSSI